MNDRGLCKAQGWKLKRGCGPRNWNLAQAQRTPLRILGGLKTLPTSTIQFDGICSRITSAGRNPFEGEVIENLSTNFTPHRGMKRADQIIKARTWSMTYKTRSPGPPQKHMKYKLSVTRVAAATLAEFWPVGQPGIGHSSRKEVRSTPHQALPLRIMYRAGVFGRRKRLLLAPYSTLLGGLMARNRNPSPASCILIDLVGRMVRSRPS